MKRVNSLKTILHSVTTGEALSNGNEPATIRLMIIDALVAIRTLTGEDAVRGWNLQKAFFDAKEIESIDIEDQDAKIITRALEEGKYMQQVKMPILLAITDITEPKTE